MTLHLYRMAGFAHLEHHIRWICETCGRVIDQHDRTGVITVQVAGLPSLAHGGQEGRYHVFDSPIGDVLLVPQLAAFLEGL